MITTINEFKNHLITEASFEQLHDQFVKTNKISQQIYDDIKQNITKSAYVTWLIKRIEDNLILPEDIYKFNEYFDIFDRHKNKFNIKDINQIKDEKQINDFKLKVLQIKELENKDKSNIKGLQKNIKYKDFIIGHVDGFDIYLLPKNDLNNYNVSCDLGSGTEWCTATGNIDEYFIEYIKTDNLFICINENTKQKFQFHFKDNMFMDKNDIDIFDDIKKYNVNFYNLFKVITDKYPQYEIPFELIIIYKPDEINYKKLTTKQWELISRYQHLSEDFIREFQDNVNWKYISEYQKLSEEFIREMNNNVYWVFISIYQKLSEDFIREFKDNVFWAYISKYQNLSEKFIKEFKDYVNWAYISKYQNLSEKFIKEFKHKIKWTYLKDNDNISEEIKNKVKNIII